ncbi:hypothetical protein [Lactiplantibacillus plantarum]|uniref:hypothetical protein n=1 Tax=Lactiplantibacillus plantarum TaxID=1590 RepID=UPI001BAE1C4D|nr:hypothetical protein [Lactiplantibacillus plantarum]MBS0955017.1 hypothetical protein [Lactiplantibacillus plantarum]
MKNAKTVSRNRISLNIKQKLVEWAKASLDWQDLDFEFKVNPHLGHLNFCHFANEISRDSKRFTLVANAYLIDLMLAERVVNQEFCLNIYKRELVRAYCYLNDHPYEDNTYLLETVLKFGGLSTLSANPKAEERLIAYDKQLNFEAYCSNCRENSVFTSDNRQTAKKLARNLPCPHCGRLLSFPDNQEGALNEIYDFQYQLPDKLKDQTINIVKLATHVLAAHEIDEDDLLVN